MAFAHYFSNCQLEVWRKQAIFCPEQLYIAILEVFERLFHQIDPSILNALSINVNAIYQWRIGENRLLHAAANEALINTRLLLAIIEICIHDYRPKRKGERFFSSQFVVEEMLKGGHVLIEDNGVLLDYIIQHTTLRPRFSSHYKANKIALYRAENRSIDLVAATMKFYHDKPDYALRAELVFNEVLFGKIIKPNGQSYTWLQFEAHSHQPRSAYERVFVRFIDRVVQLLNYSIEAFLHHVDYLRYMASGKNRNIGQYGRSMFVEANPIELTPSSF